MNKKIIAAAVSLLALIAAVAFIVIVERGPAPEPATAPLSADVEESAEKTSAYVK